MARKNDPMSSSSTTSAQTTRLITVLGSDIDPAAEQLLLESSQARGHRGAIRSVSLLNAVRLDKRKPIQPHPTQTYSSSQASGIGSSQTTGVLSQTRKAGKLKRPKHSSATDNTKAASQNGPRRKDVYELPSPEKSARRPPKPSSRKPVTRHNKESGTEKSISQANRFGLRSDDAQKELRLSSSQVTAKSASAASITTKELLLSGKVRCNAVVKSTIKDNEYREAPIYKQCEYEGMHQTDDGPRCGHHATDDHILPYNKSRDGEPNRRTSDRLAGEKVDISHIDFEKTPEKNARMNNSKRKAENKQEDDGRASKSPKTVKNLRAKRHAGEEMDLSQLNERRTRSALKKVDPRTRIIFSGAANKYASSKIPNIVAIDVESDEEDNGGDYAQAGYSDDAELSNIDGEVEESPQRKEAGQRISKRKGRPPQNNLSGTPAKPRPESAIKRPKPKSSTTSEYRPEEEEEEQEEEQEEQEEVEENEADEEDNDVEYNQEEDDNYDRESQKSGVLMTPLDRVFQFLDTAERAGRCQTTLGRKIKRSCEQLITPLQTDGTSLQEVERNTDKICSMLRDIHELDILTRPTFKTDAYGYLFLTLTRYLEALQGWLSDTCGDILESYKAIRIIRPFVSNILHFKDSIAYWKIRATQRFGGDRLTKDVDSKLIVPLRMANEDFHRQSRKLETAEEARVLHERIVERRKARMEDQKRRDEAAATRQRRWKRWQELHASRMLCEPEPRRLRGLFITKFEDIEERDANGFQFERVPVFRNRTTPPHHWSSSVEDKEWSDQQMSALIDGLRNFSGPGVLEQIFHRYCRPGGLLRDFSVLDITAKAALLRSRLLSSHQSKGWDVPEWIEQIPLLP